jgi:hypothetical protein
LYLLVIQRDFPPITVNSDAANLENHDREASGKKKQAFDKHRASARSSAMTEGCLT